MRQPRRDDKRSQVSLPGLTGRSSKSRLLDSITAASGILDRPLSRTMTTEGVAYSNFKQPRLYFVIAGHRVSPSASPMTGSRSNPWSNKKEWIASSLCHDVALTDMSPRSRRACARVVVLIPTR
jgi:hypothetical protein